MQTDKESEEVDINKYVGWIREGRSFSEIREDLRTRGLQESAVNSLIALIDERALEQAGSDQGLLQKLNLVNIGGVVLAIGVGLFAAFYQNLKEIVFLSVVLTTIAIGSTLIFVGLKSKNKKGIIARRADRRQFRQRS